MNHLSGEVGLDEAGLVERAHAGDEAAWEALVRQHQEPLFRLAYLKLGDAAAAEDAAQEALIRAYRGLGRFELGRPLRPWLMAIVSNVTANRWRSLARYRRAIGRWLAEQQSTAPAPGEALEKGDLWAAVQRLPDRDQTVIYLRYFLEFSVEECAQTLGVAAGTVKSRNSRALARLRRVLEHHYPELVEGLSHE